MKKIMVLGGSNCQLNAVKQAKERGYATLVMDYYENPPAAAWADEHLQISSFDIDACLAAASAHGVDGVVTMGTDQPLYTAARVSEVLGLPFPITAEIALNATNKQRMKTIFDTAAIPNTPHVFLKKGADEKALAQLKPPYVLKPIDSQGQRGIFRLATATEVIRHMDACLGYSRSDTVLVEEYYPNDEMTVNGWVSDGHLYMLAVTDRLSIESPTSLGVCYGHRYPTVHMNLYREIKDLSEKITAAFGVKNGPVYYQLLYGQKGLYANEISFRLGGAFEDVIIPAISGFSTVDAVLSQSLGQKAATGPLRTYAADQPKKQAAVQLLFCQSGKISSITPLSELLSLPGVLAAGYNYGVGDVIPETANATARVGHCVLLAQPHEMLSLNQAFWEKFRVLDDNGRNLAIERIIV